MANEIYTTANDSSARLDHGQALFTPTERLKIRQSLQDVLDQNSTIYIQKLDAQMALVTEQLEKLNANSNAILFSLNAGLWEHVLHPDLQQIWKYNRWHYNVVAKFLVSAIHSYYSAFSSSNQPPNAFAKQSFLNDWCLELLTPGYRSSQLKFSTRMGRALLSTLR